MMLILIFGNVRPFVRGVFGNPGGTFWKWLGGEGCRFGHELFREMELPRRRTSQTEVLRDQLAQRLGRMAEEILTRAEALQWAAAHGVGVNPKTWSNEPHRAPMFYRWRGGGQGSNGRAFYVVDDLIQWRSDVDALLKAIKDNGGENYREWPAPPAPAPHLAAPTPLPEQPKPYYTRAEKRRRQIEFERALDRL